MGATIPLAESEIVDSLPTMFVRLKRPLRAKAVWFVALLYLFCVLAPGVALAAGNAASCLIGGLPVTAAHLHNGAKPMHEVNTAHRHGEEHLHHADSSGATHDHAGHRHDGKGSPGPCCAMLCVSGIATDLPAVAKPAQPISSCVLGNFQPLPGEAPPLLYRPPIA
jgi:hypothetical protein